MKMDIMEQLKAGLKNGKVLPEGKAKRAAEGETERERSETFVVAPEGKAGIVFELTDVVPEAAERGAKRMFMHFIADTDSALFLNVDFYKKGEDTVSNSFLYRMIPSRKVALDCEFHYLDSSSFFFEPTPGVTKAQCRGREADISEMGRMVIRIRSPFCTYFNSVTISGIEFTDEGKRFDIIGEPMVDSMGQWIQENWPNKMASEKEMVAYLHAAYDEAMTSGGYPDGFDHFGGLTALTFDKTGFFHTAKKDGRWYLVDPDGHGFFSNGICYGTRMGVHGFIDGMQSMFEWLPDENDPEFVASYTKAANIPEFVKRNGKEAGEKRMMFNFARANMIKAFGKDEWWARWCDMNTRRIKSWGYNTINVGVNNYEDEGVHEYLQRAEIPFVWTLKNFPLTTMRVFRDFPDVYSGEYEQKAEAFATEQLAPFLKNPYMIGYFITNEPEWRFEEVNLAECVFASRQPLACKTAMINHLREKYGTISALNESWGSNYNAFEELLQPEKELNLKYAGAADDFDEMHRILIYRYETVVHDALKKVDPDHLDLGMRYSSTGKRVMSGCEIHDLFSFNCYNVTPEKALETSAEVADMPMIIGEWHIGCENNGKLIGGLMAAKSDEDRGKALSNYMQIAMSHKNCVGLAYFEYNDQPLLGRFDGECMQHGLIDICNRPYETVIRYVKEAGLRMYDYKVGTLVPELYETTVYDRIREE